MPAMHSDERRPLALHPLLEPQSVAVIGASANPLKVGGRPIASLRRCGFAGRIVPVNPQREEVQGLRCWPSLGAAGPVDLAVIATAATDVPRALEECLGVGARAVVVFSSGFAETGEDGRARQQELADAAGAAGCILLGPNCLGVVNTWNGLAATFTTAFDAHDPLRGRFSYIGQSGALGAYWMTMAFDARLGVSKWITTGNEAHVSLADALAYLAEDEETDVIGAYVEDIKHPAIFRAAARATAERGKAVVAIKAGRSPAGAQAVAAHTGADAGDDGAYQRLFDECGVERVSSLTEMIDAARLLLGRQPPRGGRRLAVISVSGGAGVLIADAAQEKGLEMASFSSTTIGALRDILPAYAHPRNPLDVTGAIVSDTSLLERTLAVLAASDDSDAVLLFLGSMHSIADGLVAAIKAVTARAEKTVAVVWMSGPAERLAELQDAGVPAFADIPNAVDALARAARLMHGRGGRHRAPR